MATALQLCSTGLPLTILIFLLLVASGSNMASADEQQRALPAGEQEALYHVMESVNPAVHWRYLYPDDLCLYGPHGVVCDLFDVPPSANGSGAAGGGDAVSVPHVVELNFGYVSDFTPNPPCGGEPAFSASLSAVFFPFLRKLFFYRCFSGSRAALPATLWDDLPSSMEEIVFIENPSLVGRISRRIGAFPRLRRFILTGTRVSGDIPDTIGRLGSLQQLDLSRNRLRGGIPRSIGRCKALKVLDLSINHISGSLPPEIGRLDSLVKLDLSGNRISDPVPREFAGLRRLELLDLSHNNITGGVPAALAAMANLKELHLSGNPLGGQIPAEIWGNLGGLLGIGMSNAGLVGGIPASMGLFLSKLCYLGLDNNRLRGGVPEQLRLLEGTAGEINLENNLLNGRVPFSGRFVAGMGAKLRMGGNPALCLDGELAVAGAPERRAAGSLSYLGPCNDTKGTSPPAVSLSPTSSAAPPPCFWFPVLLRNSLLRLLPLLPLPALLLFG